MTEEEKTIWRNRLFKISRLLHERIERLSPESETIALTGIARHIIACEKTGCSASVEALSEIIRDAKVGRQVYAQTGEDKIFVGNHTNKEK